MSIDIYRRRANDLFLFERHKTKGQKHLYSLPPSFESEIGFGLRALTFACPAENFNYHLPEKGICNKGLILKRRRFQYESEPEYAGKFSTEQDYWIAYIDLLDGRLMNWECGAGYISFPHKNNVIWGYEVDFFAKTLDKLNKEEMTPASGVFISRKQLPVGLLPGFTPVDDKKPSRVLEFDSKGRIQNFDPSIRLLNEREKTALTGMPDKIYLADDYHGKIYRDGLSDADLSDLSLDLGKPLVRSNGPIINPNGIILPW